jgi:hypothetical protein
MALLLLLYSANKHVTQHREWKLQSCDAMRLLRKQKRSEQRRSRDTGYPGSLLTDDTTCAPAGSSQAALGMRRLGAANVSWGPGRAVELSQMTKQRHYGKIDVCMVRRSLCW